MFFQGELIIILSFFRYVAEIASYSWILMDHAYFQSMLIVLDLLLYAI